MHEEHPHPLLAQIPLTVSPFLSLPTGTTLPYTYKTLPSTLPPSILDSPPSNQPQNSSHPGGASQAPQPAYIHTPSGASAHPSSIAANCRSLQEHLRSLGEEGRKVVGEWERGVKERELAEKRRVAPGWLDRAEGERLLVPERKRKKEEDLLTGGEEEVVGGKNVLETKEAREARELDEAFGGMGVK